MSDFAEKVKKWYLSGFWTIKMVDNAFKKERLTEDEYNEIINSK